MNSIANKKPDIAIFLILSSLMISENSSSPIISEKSSSSDRVIVSIGISLAINCKRCSALSMSKHFIFFCLSSYFYQ